MKIAVTGAGGFIGRHVCAELALRNATTVAADLTLERLHGVAGARLVALDMAAPGTGDYDALGRPDVLIHLAWGGLPRYGALDHFEVELPRHYQFIKALVEDGLPALVAAGTCLEYGLQEGRLSEEAATQPTTPYGFAKDALRRQLEFLRAQHAFAFTWARLFYLYGDGQAARALYPALRAAIARGDDSFAMSWGEQLRDYLPIGEAARLLVELALRRADVGPVNVCSGEPVSVRRLVEGWIQERGATLRLGLGRLGYQDYEPLAFWGDRRRLDARLGQP